MKPNGAIIVLAPFCGRCYTFYKFVNQTVAYPFSRQKIQILNGEIFASFVDRTEDRESGFGVNIYCASGEEAYFLLSCNASWKRWTEELPLTYTKLSEIRDSETA